MNAAWMYVGTPPFDVPPNTRTGSPVASRYSATGPHTSAAPMPRRWRSRESCGRMETRSTPGTDRISFPAGIPFHRLKSLEENWPYKGKTNYLFPQDHGYQFRGYHLDAMRRPTFLYRYGDIAVEDYFEDVRGNVEEGLGETIALIKAFNAINFRELASQGLPRGAEGRRALAIAGQKGLNRLKGLTREARRVSGHRLHSQQPFVRHRIKRGPGVIAHQQNFTRRKRR